MLMYLTNVEELALRPAEIWTKFDDVSFLGVVAYGVACAENYVIAKYPERDFTPAFDRLWGITAAARWDCWDESIIDILPECLFDFPGWDSNIDKDDESYTLDEASYLQFRHLSEGMDDDWNEILDLLRNTVNDDRDAALASIEAVAEILEQNGVELPEPSLIAKAMPKRTPHDFSENADPSTIARIYGQPGGLAFLCAAPRWDTLLVCEDYFPLDLRIKANTMYPLKSEVHELECTYVYFKTESGAQLEVSLWSKDHSILRLLLLGCEAMEAVDEPLAVPACPEGYFVSFLPESIPVEKLDLTVFQDGARIAFSTKPASCSYRCGQLVVSFAQDDTIASFSISGLDEGEVGHIVKEAKIWFAESNKL